MTPFDMAAKLAQKAGPRKCKTWRAGFRDTLLGVPHCVLFQGKVEVAQIMAYADGRRAAKELSEEAEGDLVRGPCDGMPLAEAIAAIMGWSEAIRLRRAVSEHDRAVQSYHDHVAAMEVSA